MSGESGTSGNAKMIGAVVVALAALLGLGYAVDRVLVTQAQFEEFRRARVAFEFRVELQLKEIEQLVRERRPVGRR